MKITAALAIVIILAMRVSAQSTPTPIGPQTADQLVELQTLEGHSEAITDVAFTQDSPRLISAADDTSVMLWDAASGAALSTQFEHFSFVKGIALHESVVASSSWDRSVRLWSIVEDELVPLEIHSGYPAVTERLDFSPDGQLLAFGVGNGTVHVVSTATQAEQFQFSLAALQVTAVAFSPDGATLAAAGGFPEQGFHVWDVTSGEPVRSQITEGAGITALAFHPTEAEVIAAAGDDGTLRIFQDDEETAVIAFDDWINDVTFSPDGLLLAAALQDGSLHFWDVERERMITAYRISGEPLNAIAFSHHGTLLAVAGEDQVIHVLGVWE